MERMKKTFRQGFSLVELLVVMAIMGILLVAATSVFQSISSSTNLSSGAAQLSSQINLARQLALTHNRVTEVRFLMGPTGIGNSQAILGVQTFVDKNTDGIFNADEAASKIEWLPTGISASKETTQSSLLGATATGRVVVGGRGEIDYAALRFRPDGSPLPAQPNTANNAWGLAVMAARDLSLSDLPPNFVMISLNPTTGRLRSFQP